MQKEESVIGKIDFSTCGGWSLNIQHFADGESIVKFLSIDSISFDDMRELVLKIESSLVNKNHKKKSTNVRLLDHNILITNRGDDRYDFVVTKKSTKALIYDASLHRRVLIDIFISSPLVVP